jgi:serine/threonine-protein kinase
MICPACNADNVADTEECFGCGRSLFALTQGRVLADRYEIRRPIGQGGMGKVYEAFDRVLEERCAIKVLRPQFAREPDMAKRFLSEIRLARRITHPNVCRLHEYGDSGGLRYLCMELVDGVNLKEVLRARRLGTEDAYDVALAAAEGLGAVHAQGVIHRDFKTANIMIDRRGQVKVMDFGIAKEVGSETTGISLAGHVMGTPEYMSPEHVQGGRIDFRSDLYALGCVIFEVFAGRTLFQGGSPIDTLRRHLSEPLVFVSDTGPIVPEPLIPVLTRALAKRADDRYPSVAALIEDLRSARADSALYAVLGADEPLADVAALLSTPLEPPPPPLPEPEPLESRVVASAEGVGDTGALTSAAKPSGARPAPRASRPAARLAAIGSTAVIVSVLAFVGLRRPQPGPDPAAPPPSVANAPSPTAAVGPAPTIPAPRLEEVPATTLRSRPTAVAPRAERQRPSPEPPALPSPPPSTLAASPAPSPDPARVAETSMSPNPIATPAPVISSEIGVISLIVVPPSDVLVDGTALGTVSSRRELRLSAGSHVLVFENPDYHPFKRTVTVEAGTSKPLVVDLSQMGVRKPRSK